jgi:NTP pyrophosphatase (non-canonical NTP hydrolase)
MNLADLVLLQNQFDAKHGWNPDKGVPTAIFRAIQGDLIGILGEVGEFANIVKKVALETDHDPASDLAALLKARHGDFSEELVDALIYLIRLASHLDIDMEQAYLDKLNVNEQRFKRFERPLS